MLRINKGDSKGREVSRKATVSVGSNERVIKTEQRSQIRYMKKERGLSGKHWPLARQMEQKE